MSYQKILDLKHKHAQKMAEARKLLEAKDLEGHQQFLANEVAPIVAEIEAHERQLAAEGKFDDDDSRMKGMAFAQKKQNEDEEAQKSVDAIRSTKEYARAFAAAMRDGASVKRCAGVEKYQPLYKALTEGGGSPAGADGGFLVPLDFDNAIVKMEKDYFDLSRFFNVETVGTLSGWRAIESGVPTALPKVAEMAAIGTVDQPKFRQVEYSVSKYADRLPIANELLEDNAANLLAYVADWFVPKYILTKNALLLALLDEVTTTVALTSGSEDKILRKALIQKLNTAHSRQAVLLTNQDGYAAMEGWEDTTKRPLLVPNPTDPQVLRYRGRTVAYGDNAEMPNDGSTVPLYVGNFKALGTLFVRKGIELATTNVGGNAWETDSTEIRAICRLDAQIIHPEAAFKATIAGG